MFDDVHTSHNGQEMCMLGHRVDGALRLGVLGLGRGLMLAEATQDSSLVKVTAVCDRDQARLEIASERLGVQTYTSFQDLLAGDVDAVLLANHFHEHARFAIEALTAGKHVLSETAACFTGAEAVELVEAAEAAAARGVVYMLAENYVFLPFVQLMSRMYASGDIGRLQYAEAEYVHPISADDFRLLAPGKDHWRNWLPLIYYCSHTLAPVMTICGQRPVAVSGFAIPFDDADASLTGGDRRADPGGVIMVQLSDGALARLLQGTIRGESVGVRLHGSSGIVESMRSDRTKIWHRREFGDAPGSAPISQFLDAPENAEGGHGGTDLATVIAFAEAVRNEEIPVLDVYQAIDLALVGILAYRSALEGSILMPVPDLRDPNQRRALREDHWRPGPAAPTHGNPWPSVRGEIAKSPRLGP